MTPLGLFAVVDPRANFVKMFRKQWRVGRTRRWLTASKDTIEITVSPTKFGGCVGNAIAWHMDANCSSHPPQVGKPISSGICYACGAAVEL
jgi:hypothetical protein